jgi:hypothetical protein
VGASSRIGSNVRSTLKWLVSSCAARVGCSCRRYSALACAMLGAIWQRTIRSGEWQQRLQSTFPVRVLKCSLGNVGNAVLEEQSNRCEEENGASHRQRVRRSRNEAWRCRNHSFLDLVPGRGPDSRSLRPAGAPASSCPTPQVHSRSPGLDARPVARSRADDCTPREDYPRVNPRGCFRITTALMCRCASSSRSRNDPFAVFRAVEI